MGILLLDYRLKMLKKTNFFVFFWFTFLFLVYVPAQNKLPYPEIKELNAKDPVFSQYSDDVASARQVLARGLSGTEIPLNFYLYRVKKGDTLISIAARCTVAYDALATINRLASVEVNLTDKILLIPSLPALYLFESAQNDLENLLFASLEAQEFKSFSLYVYTPEGTKEKIRCVPDTVFSGTVRAFFLTPAFKFPLQGYTLTSSFGIRKNPVTGNEVFHKGIDLAAPLGTAVYACGPGIVKEMGYDPIYGNYVIIAHSGGRESLYGHLSTIKIELRQSVKSSTILGTVGSTGQSTGPHLHFEIHENGAPKNPTGIIKGK